MNLYPFDDLQDGIRPMLWNVIINEGDFIPRFCYTLPSTFSYDQQTMAYDWAEASNVNIFVSVVLKLAIFDNEESAALFKLWL